MTTLSLSRPVTRRAPIAARVVLVLAWLKAWRGIVINGGAVVALAAMFTYGALVLLIALGWY